MNQTSGSAFEDWLSMTHRQYEKNGLAWIEKNYVQSRFFAGDGHAKLVPTGKALPDYSGVLAGGRGVFLEAKSTANKESLSLPRDREHQYAYLQQAHRYGCYAFYVVYWEEHCEVRLYDIANLPKVFGVEPLRREQGIKVIPDGGLCDWLSAIVPVDTQEARRKAVERSIKVLSTFMSRSQAQSHLREISIILQEELGVIL